MWGAEIRNRQLEGRDLSQLITSEKAFGLTGLALSGRVRLRRAG